MWDNDTIVGFTQAEKNWFASLSVEALRAIGFDSEQRFYLKGTVSYTTSIKKPKGFRNYPTSFPRNSAQYQAASAFTSAEVTFSVNPFVSVSNSNNNVSQVQQPTQPDQSIHSWSDSNVVDLSPPHKKWLSNRSISDLRRWGFSHPQREYLRSFIGYDGTPVRPAFTLDTIPPAPIPPAPISLFSSEESEISADSDEMNEDEEPVSSVDPFVETAHDLEVKYLDCLGIKNNHIIKAVGFSTSSGKNTIQYKKIDAFGNASSTIEEKFDQTFDFTLPKLGMINYDDHVIYIERTHKKSSPGRYRKGLRSDAIKFYNLSFRELKSLGKIDVTNPSQYNYEDISRKLANAIFLPETLTFKEAIDEVLSFKRLSAAFTSSLAIKLDSNLNKIILQKHNWMIGEYNCKNNLFEMYIDTFNDDLIKLNIPFKVAA